MNPEEALKEDAEGIYISYDKLQDLLAEQGVFVGPYLIEKNNPRKLRYTKDLFIEWLRESWLINEDCMIWFPVTNDACNSFIVDAAPKGIQNICRKIRQSYNKYANEDGVIRLYIIITQL